MLTSDEIKQSAPSSWAKLIGHASDPYERKARLYPALLTLVPVLGIGLSLYGLSRDVAQSFVAIATALGGAYLLVNVGRERGKRIENRLFEQWGGAPTTQLQRHRDARVDPITKQARHVFLSQKLGIPAPTAAVEISDPLAADHFYAASSRWLLEHTRDRQRFPLLFQENVSYGYRRNALGLKPMGICICLVSIVWVLSTQGFLTSHGLEAAALLHMTRGAQLSIAISLVMLAIWFVFFTRKTAETAAFAYADMLLRACTILE